MRQTLFEAEHGARWEAFERWLAADAALRSRRATERSLPFPAAELPERYRELCQHLALARDRRYGADLIERLNALALAGHATLYGARSASVERGVEFLIRGFPRLVRAHWPFMLAGALLFFGPLVALIFAVPMRPDIAHYFLEPQQMASMQEMYSDSAERLGRRDASNDVMMFAYYVWNNVRIGFQTFAGGLLFGLGSLFFLVFNGLTIGAVAGFLVDVGLADSFWSFVSGHSAPELIAIALSGGAGLLLARALVAPGALSRRQALVEASRPAVRIMIGAALLFLLAAFIEGFWSPHRYVPYAWKLGLGIALWVLILGYLAFAGRSRGG